jgi:hypothetical protein
MLDRQIGRIHSGAVCKEIGERLSLELGPQSNELPPRLLSFMGQLAKVDAPEDDAAEQPTAD